MPVLIILLFMILVLTGIALVHVLRRNGMKVNRWLFGIAAFLIVLIPSVLIGPLPRGIEWTLYVFSALFAVMFFETSRVMLQNNEMKGVVRSDHFNTKEKDTKK